MEIPQLGSASFFPHLLFSCFLPVVRKSLSCYFDPLSDFEDGSHD